MKILHLITTLDRGGAETQLVELVSQQIAAGNQVSVAFLKGKGELTSELNALGAVVMSNLLFLNPIFQVTRLRFVIQRQGSFDIMHSHLPRAELLGYFSVRGNCKLIVSRHNTELFWPNGPHFVSRWLSKLIISKSSFVVCISNAVKVHLTKYKEVRVNDLHKLVVVYYGFRSRIREPNLRTQDNVASPPLHFVTVSRLTPQKDLKTMLEGFSLYSKKNQNAKLTIVGQGHLRDWLVNLIGEMGLNSQVELIESVDDVPNFLRSFDVFLLSSKYEGFGLVLLEAMQAQIPIISSNSAAAKEVLGERYPGLFPIGDSAGLAQLLEKFGKDLDARALIKYGEGRLLQFSPGLMADNMHLVYQKAIFS